MQNNILLILNQNYKAKEKSMNFYIGMLDANLHVQTKNNRSIITDVTAR